MAKYVVLASVLFGLTACGDTWGQRAVTGGAIGAGSGAAVGALTPLDCVEIGSQAGDVPRAPS